MYILELSCVVTSTKSGGAVASWLVCSSLDRAVEVQAPARNTVVFLVDT